MKNDIIEQNGKYFFNNGYCYIGRLINYSLFWEGIIYKKYDHNNKNSIIYEGDFVEDKMEGKGKLFYDNGEY